jgi:hypothetical protein
MQRDTELELGEHDGWIATRSEHTTEALTLISEGGAFRTAIPEEVHKHCFDGQQQGFPKRESQGEPWQRGFIRSR